MLKSLKLIRFDRESVLRNRKESLIAALLIKSVLVTAHAAQEEVIWGRVDQYPGLQTRKLLREYTDLQKTKHRRYAQYYQGIAVWGAEVIYHQPQGFSEFATGIWIRDIHKDIGSLKAVISPAQAINIATTKIKAISKPRVEKRIFITTKKQAVLSYYVSFAADGQLPRVLINASTGEVLHQWDASNKNEVGQGPGGVTFNNLTYRPGQYQFGNAINGLLALGKMDVQVANTNCIMQNALFFVVNLLNQTKANLPFSFPVSYQNEQTYNLQPFQYACNPPDYLNNNDNGYAPANMGISPINDVNYFVLQTNRMLTTHYMVTNPIANELPLRIYTHIADYDNATACSTYCMDESNVDGPPQLNFGNGDNQSAPLTDPGTCGHEFCHLVTDNFSRLIYAQQSGGVNESFSDMCDFALKNYLTKTYPWLWNGQDWTIGLDISKTQTPVRYMNNPPLDGHSIDNAANFEPDMDVHYSSGVFNKAFYLLSTTPGWNVDRAFEVMLQANMNYWIPSSSFDFASCGAIQAAYDRGYSYQDVINVFQNVGVTCLVGVKYWQDESQPTKQVTSA